MAGCLSWAPVISNQIQMLGQTIIEEATIRKIIVESSGCLFNSSNPEANIMKVNYSGSVFVYNDLVVSGNISASNLNPYHVAGRFNGVNQIVLASKGKNAFVVQRTAVGFYKISWTEAHPDGGNFLVFAQGEAVPTSAWNIIHNANTGNQANTSTSVCFVVRDNNFVSIDGTMNFVVLA